MVVGPHSIFQGLNDIFCYKNSSLGNLRTCFVAYLLGASLFFLFVVYSRRLCPKNYFAKLFTTKIYGFMGRGGLTPHLHHLFASVSQCCQLCRTKSHCALYLHGRYSLVFTSDLCLYPTVYILALCQPKENNYS